MKKILKGILPGLLLITITSTAFAENRSGSFNLSPFIGGYVLDKDQAEKNGAIIGLRGGYNFTKHLGAEGMFGYSRTESKQGSHDTDMYRYGADFLFHFMPDSSFVPFVAIGGGGVTFNIPDHSSAQNHYAGLIDYGGGVKYFVTDNIALRGDVRHVLLIHDSGENNFEYSAGLTFQFGGKSKAVAALAAAPEEKAAYVPVDSDNDGVPDSLDKCPGTPADVTVDKNGCPLDSDGDGVPDYLDKCPGTPAGVSVDKNGCPPVAEKTVVLASEPKVAVLVFEDIHFEFDKSTLTPDAKRILKRDILLLKENPRTIIRIAGYTSASGTEEYNQKLSERRARSVQEYLISEGVITRDRLSTVGYGETRPAVREATPSDIDSKAAQANMRVLFEIIVQ